MHRFFIQAGFEKDMTIRIENEDFLHLKNSLRIKTGELIEISDGHMNTFCAYVNDFKKDYCEAVIGNKIQNTNEPECKITLYPAILKGDRFENMIQKCIEGGVYAIKPVITSNTIVDLDEKNADKKVERWSRVCKLACMQSKRDILVNIEKPVKLYDAVDYLSKVNDRKYISFVCYEAERENSIKRILDEAVEHGKKDINIFIGPEGGFQEKEIKRLNDHEIHAVHIGKRILRADTAAFSAVFYTAMRYELYNDLIKNESYK